MQQLVTHTPSRSLSAASGEACLKSPSPDEKPPLPLSSSSGQGTSEVEPGSPSRPLPLAFDRNIPCVSNYHIPRLPLASLPLTSGRGGMESPLSSFSKINGGEDAGGRSAARAEAAAAARMEAAEARQVTSSPKGGGLFSRVKAAWEGEGSAILFKTGRQDLEAMGEQLEAITSCMRTEQQVCGVSHLLMY